MVTDPRMTKVSRPSQNPVSEPKKLKKRSKGEGLTISPTKLQRLQVQRGEFALGVQASGNDSDLEPMSPERSSPPHRQAVHVELSSSEEYGGEHPEPFRNQRPASGTSTGEDNDDEEDEDEAEGDGQEESYPEESADEDEVSTGKGRGPSVGWAK